MKQIQGSFLTGYVTIAVKGYSPERFFQKCINENIAVWNVKKQSDNVCTGNVKLSDLATIRKIRFGTDYKITFLHKRGYPFFIKRFLRKKEIVIALLLSVLLVFFLSNIIWEVRISGVSKDVEKQIAKKLDSYGVHQGAWTLSLDPPKKVQQKLISDVPELLWIGVHQKGTSYVLEGVEKKVVEEEKVPGPRNLVAAKKGVVIRRYVKKGVPQVQVNDYVEPGDLLVSGVLGKKEEGDDKEEEESPLERVAAEGEIIAKTWYESKVTVPLKASYELITGNQEHKYHLKIDQFEFPVWGFSDPDYNEVHRQRIENDIYFLKWKLPIKFIETVLSEKTYNNVQRTKDEAIQTGIKQAKNELLLQLEKDAKIVSENILHETTGNGKVKLTLYMAVEENIAKAEPINQGD